MFDWIIRMVIADPRWLVMSSNGISWGLVWLILCLSPGDYCNTFTGLFWARNHQMTYSAQGGAGERARLLLTKNPRRTAQAWVFVDSLTMFWWLFEACVKQSAVDPGLVHTRRWAVRSSPPGKNQASSFISITTFQKEENLCLSRNQNMQLFIYIFISQKY